MIPKTTIIREEQETVITIDPLAKRACVYSCIPNVVKKLYKYTEEHEDAHIDLDNEYGQTISVPMNWIKVRPPVKREYTEEQKQIMSARLKEVRKKK